MVSRSELSCTNSPKPDGLCQLVQTILSCTNSPKPLGLDKLVQTVLKELYAYVIVLIQLNFLN